MTEPTRVCTKCGKELPATPEYFHKKKRGKYGVSSRCKPCHHQEVTERKKERCANDPEYAEHLRRYSRERYANDPEYAEYHRRYYRERYANDPDFRERRRGYFRKYYHGRTNNDSSGEENES